MGERESEEVAGACARTFDLRGGLICGWKEHSATSCCLLSSRMRSCCWCRM